MNERRKPYPFDQLEPKWQAFWDERRSFHALNPGEKGFDPAKPKFYVLDMFPYPSGAGLHVGHPEGYTATDIIARYKRLCGFNVLHPMGWDAFGLPAEQYAIKTGQHPAITTRENVAKFKTQLKRIGFSYDWEREIITTDPNYFKWTQWIFLQIYDSWFNPETKRAERISTYRGSDPDSVRLAYVAEVPVNWCQELGTVLANEEVIDGKSEVGGFPVVRRPMRQWMLRITMFADRLIDELEGLDWPDSIKALQRNWIGRSQGAEIRFAIADGGLGDTITVFTTRPDTIYGATYMVLAPENPLVDRITAPEHRQSIADYRKMVAAKSDLERTDLAKDKTGAFTGGFAINPVNDERIPIWIADYVLMTYGTGAIMGVPAHDERDHEFARKFQLKIVPVVQAPGKSPEESIGYTDVGVAVNSPLLNGLSRNEATARIIDWLEEQKRGRRDIRYKLRDWLFSRQRYWGEPFPIVWRDGKHKALSESELPLEPPALEDFKPTGTGEPPLAKAKDWLRYKSSSASTGIERAKEEGEEEYLRETNTMPQWAGSCWYYLRFCDPQNNQRFIGKEAESYWSGSDPIRNPQSAIRNCSGAIDLYIGGTEHAVLHLLYARFWHKVLFDLGYLSKPEPFQRLVNQGIILGEDNQKMSKSRGNIVNPDDVIDQYGADAFRCYEMFMGPLEQMKPWSMRGVEGVARFLARVWRLIMEENQAGEWVLSDAVEDIEPAKTELKVLHATIKKVTGDIETLSFNTAISQMMVMVNTLTNTAPKPVSALRTLLVLLNPFAPHLSSELWQMLADRFPGVTGDITEQRWPEHNEAFLVEDEIEIILQVNGKLRDKITVALDATNAEIEAAARASQKVLNIVGNQTIRKVVVVPKKLVNIVTG